MNPLIKGRWGLHKGFTGILNHMWKGALVLLLISGCSSTPVPSETVVPDFSKKEFFVLRCTVLHSSTHETLSGWRISVDHGLLGYSGPPLGRHFSQDYTFGPYFYVCVAPTSTVGDPIPERLAIHLTRHGRDLPPSKPSFLITREMWENGTWRNPRPLHGGRPGDYRLMVERTGELVGHVLPEE